MGNAGLCGARRGSGARQGGAEQDADGTGGPETKHPCSPLKYLAELFLRSPRGQAKETLCEQMAEQNPPLTRGLQPGCPRPVVYLIPVSGC